MSSFETAALGPTRAWVSESGTSKLPAFWIDRREVTNRQFKEFVVQGGYEQGLGPYGTYDMAGKVKSAA